ncbi:MAG: flagellin FliC [Brevibacterium aurantiacum]|nr:flagellin FliC [Brevibacterium aurantiacum]
MGLQINTNVAALNAYRNLTGTQGSMQTSLERLSSGLRINRAADDAAGLAISEKLRSQVNGLNQAQANAQDGVSLIQTAEGAMNETHAMLQRMRTLSIQAKSDTNTSSDRAAIQKEVGALLKEIDSTTTRTQFNGMNLLDGTFTGKALQIGANAGQTMSVSIKKMDTTGLSLTGLNVTSTAGLASALSKIDNAIGKVSDQRADLGALQNRLDHTIKNLGVSSENLAASESRIRDTDMAKEMTNFTRSQILQQAGTAMLAQANQSTQGVLRLLG